MATEEGPSFADAIKVKKLDSHNCKANLHAAFSIGAEEVESVVLEEIVEIKTPSTFDVVAANHVLKGGIPKHHGTLSNSCDGWQIRDDFFMDCLYLLPAGYMASANRDTSSLALYFVQPSLLVLGVSAGHKKVSSSLLHRPLAKRQAKAYCESHEAICAIVSE
ncbi:hypothetical protein X797_010652 [Metarhizium robertsii]|uniref:Uncharacterized protein n=2 Tax=Metarhizium robertsii TaxID=568076 RepID=E9FBN8_METRA|nr:uncharacterized protein MAA_09687 [Metarhizium robertsii ARSEF 23]EFY94857.1 hypothetical protein MAA_09687 [Metarhizium robertsii ARSEF 23]EXU96267.1 hypothetical protein X797_010652 [Metarhizium robertsii]